MSARVIPDVAGPRVQVTVRSPEDQHATVLRGDVREEYDLAQLLDFTRDLEGAVSQHAALQSYWEALAVDVTRRFHEFEEAGYALWWAHARRWARYVLVGGGTRDATQQTLKDTVIHLFSEGAATSEVTFQGQIQLAFRGLLLERLGSAKKTDDYLARSEADLEVERAAVASDMMAYVDQGWTYEQIQRKFAELRTESEQVQGFCKAVNARGYKMREYAELTRPKFTVGPPTTSPFAGMPAKRSLAFLPILPNDNEKKAKPCHAN